MAFTRRPRRGVVLLLVLSLLVLFVLLGMTFLIGATRYRHGAESFSQNDLHGDPPDKIADIAVLSLLREPASPFSSLWGHSLLRDLYGDSERIEGTGAIANAGNTRDLVRINVTAVTTGTVRLLEDYYAGNVLSMFDGLGSTTSVRVVQYVPSDATNGGRPVFYVERPDRPVSSPIQFLVNGKPFNGQGQGFDPTLGRADLALVSGLEFALMPHYAAYLAATSPPGTAAGTAPSLPGGDSDESYDTFDHQNMFLAGVPPLAAAGILPSFHRPALIDYWIRAGHDGSANLSVLRRDYLEPQGVTDENEQNRVLLFPFGPDGQENTLDDPPRPSLAFRRLIASITRAVVFRPLPQDHPNFTGSNPVLDPSSAVFLYDQNHTNNNATEYALLQALLNSLQGGSWDVDNDGDGRLDSIWLDPRLPVKTASNGRAYRPLVSFLCVDLDSRLNVNAHANVAQVTSEYNQGTIGAPNLTGRPYAGGFNGTLAQLNNTTSLAGGLARGQGYGPTEISFRHLLDRDAEPTFVDFANMITARYGSDTRPGGAGEDALSFIKSIGRPAEYAAAISATYGSWDNPSAYLSPADIFGRGTVGLDYSGRPVWQFASRLRTPDPLNLAIDERANDPYELNLVQPDGKDTPFTPSELERLLRQRDSDAGSLSSRLYELLSNDFGDFDSDGTVDVNNANDRRARTADEMAELSKLLTTLSFHVPAPPTAPLPPQPMDTSGANPVPDYNAPHVYNILYPARDPNNPSYDYYDNMDPQYFTPGTYGWWYQNPAQIAFRDPNQPRQVLPPPTLMDLLAAKIVLERRVATPAYPPLTAAQLQGVMNQLLPFEIRHGQKMNINRLWGDGEAANVPNPFGRTDVVDEIPEVDTEVLWDNVPYNNPSTAYANPTANYVNNDNVVPATPSIYHPRGREVFARNLFTMMLLLVDLESTGAFASPANFLEPYLETGLTPTEQRELTIQRIAQWAINVVDFRDADAIMTPFEYDVNPFNGWGWVDPNTGIGHAIDGDISTDDLGPNMTDGLNPVYPPPAEANPERRVVWGCEFPDLLITEVGALHDRRSKDTDQEVEVDAGYDTAGPTEDDIDSAAKIDDMDEPDSSLDQYRIPQGSLMVELYCPRRGFWVNSTNPAERDLTTAPRELYNIDNNGVRLDLARQPVQPSGDGFRYPVWRLAISEGHQAASGLENLSPWNRTNTNDMNNFRPDSTTFEPMDPLTSAARDMSKFPQNATTNPGALNIERIVWFAQVDPASHPNAATAMTLQNQVYWNRHGRTDVPAGEYLVVAPRAETRVGVLNDGGDPSADTFNPPSEQRFLMANDPMTNFPMLSYEGDGAVPYPNYSGKPAGAGPFEIKKPWMMIAAANVPDAWVAPATTAHLAPGFTPPMGAPSIFGLGLSVSEPLRDTYYREPNAFLDPTGATADYPLMDTWRDTPTGGTFQLPDVPFDSDPLYEPPLADPGMTRDTHVWNNYRTVFLQRLANPLLPFHETLNPYLTVDWSPIDLTVFNGEDRDGAEPDPDDGNSTPSTGRPVRNDPPFETRERDGFGRWVLWKTRTSAANDSDDLRGVDDMFNLNFRHSLGYLNRKLDTDPIIGGTTDLPHNMFNQVEAAQDPSLLGEPKSIATPANTFPWLTWNDRPYSSHLELMAVPASSQSRLLFEYSFVRPDLAAPGNPTQNEIAPRPASDGQPHYPFTANPSNPYSPLPSTTGPERALAVASYRAPFGHLLNFFHSTIIDPTTGAPRNNVGFIEKGADFYRIFDFVETPARFVGTEKWFNPDDFDSEAEAARYRPPFNWLSRFREPGRINVNTVTDSRIWAGVSRSYPAHLPPSNDKWASVIQTASRQNSLITVAISPTTVPNPFQAVGSAALAALPALRHNGIEATPLRHYNEPANNQVVPLFNTTSTSPAINTDRNPYFRYQGLQRLGNLVSTHSNTFAVWVTVGYFEVEPNPDGVTTAHPDGVRLGQELNAETGDVQRHRAFYIIDRSIPVAFQPGTNHNVENTILLRRFIE
jgi:hypothetical protein